MKNEPLKMDGKSLDVAAENRARLKQLFPAVFTETKNDKGEIVEAIDAEKLKAELGTFTELFENRRERYGMDWPGKKEALHLIQTPSRATLTPSREESVNFDTTENAFIEGDNLEVLKLLQKSYYGKVKMIYIDPPYNTGNEFIYPDNYSESLETYLEYAGLINGDGKKFSTNTANEGRFHTRWLNMMYPRLFLARNLLKEDGVIFISIGEEELANLTCLCSEIFGETNKISTIARVAKTASNKGTHFAPSVDFILAYAKNIQSLPPFKDEVDVSLYKKEDAQGRYRDDVALYQSALDPMRGCVNQRYYIACPDGSFVIPPGNAIPMEKKDAASIKPKTGEDKVWRWSYATYLERKKLLVFKETKNSPLLNQNGQPAKYNIYTKSYLSDRQELGTVPRNYLDEFINRQGADLLKKYGIQFSFSKPVELIIHLIKITNTTKDDVVLDFFAGSATTAHAVLDINHQDGGARKFLMVQLPEPYAAENGAEDSKFKTIADIGKERIRRVIKDLNDEKKGNLDLDNSSKQDFGFRVLKLNKSSFKQWRDLPPTATPEEITKQLELHIDHINKDSTQEGLLFELLLKSGFMPTQKVEKKKCADKAIFSIAEGALLICLEDRVTKELADAVIAENPQQFICLDSAFGGNDQLKANIVQTFAAHNMQKEKHNQIVFKTV